MTTLDDLDLFPEPDDRNFPTKGCARHAWGPPVDGVVTCTRCPKVRDEMARTRNMRNAKRGKAIQRKRIEALGGMNLQGNKENHDGIGLAFSYESKSGGAFSQRYWRWLQGIPVRGDQTRVLIVTETPGPGRRAHAYVVVDYDQWRDLHGEKDVA